MAEIENEAVGFPVIYETVVKELTHGGSTLIFSVYTMFSCIKIVVPFG